MKAAFVGASLILIAALSMSSVAKAEWTIDLSRRTNAIRERDLNDFGNEPDFDQAQSRSLGGSHSSDGSSGRWPASESDGSGEGKSSGRAPASVRAFSDNSGASLDPGSGTPRKLEAESSGGTILTKVLRKIVQVSEPGQEIVIMQTENGFVPNTVRLRKDARYTIHLVNVNEKEKNVSFILDAFSEHHATYFGKVRTFTLEPKKEGIFSFQSPETAAEGRLIVYTQTDAHDARTPASTASSDSGGTARGQKVD